MVVFFLSALLITQLALFVFSAIVTVCRIRGTNTLPENLHTEPTSIIVSIATLNAAETEYAAMAINLAGPEVEVLFCSDDASEQSAVTIQKILTARNLNQNSNVRLLSGTDQITRNPKVDNLQKGYNAARYDAIVLLDGNAKIPPNFISQLWEVWTPTIGLVSTTPLISEATSFWANVEASLLNWIYARWLLTGEFFGATFANGKLLAFSRSWLEENGGLNVLNACVAEDTALTHLAQKTRTPISLLKTSLRQPVGSRGASEVLSKTLRWMKTRRTDIPLIYAVEPIYSFVALLVLSGVCGYLYALPILLIWLGLLIFWHILEAYMVIGAGQKWTPMFHLHILTRDAFLIPLWVFGWFGNHYEWRGRTIRFRD